MANKERTELQQKFLEALFGDAQGNVREAMRMAGYAENTKVSEVVRALRDDIVEQANMVLALNSPRAAMELVGLLVDPNQVAAPTKLRAIQEILNRVGVDAPKQDQDINLKVPQGGLFIMPAKGNDKEIKDEEDNEG
jgi:hypothetical protein